MAPVSISPGLHWVLVLEMNSSRIHNFLILGNDLKNFYPFPVLPLSKVFQIPNFHDQVFKDVSKQEDACACMG
jgi:hypothetical protein